MKSGPPRRPLRACARSRRHGTAAVRAADVRREPRRGDRLADVDAPHPRAGRRRRRLPRPRVRPGERRHRLVAEGHPRREDHRPRPGRPRRRRAREGPQRDPRRGGPRPAHPRAERPLAGRHVQRRRRRRRHPSQRRRRALRARGRRPGRPARGPRGGRGGDSRPARRTSPCPTRPPRSTDMARWWPMEKLERSGRLVDHAVALASRLGFEVKDTSTGGASDANSTAGMGDPLARRPRPDRRQRPLAGGVPGRRPRSCRGRRSSPRCCSRSAAIRSSSAGEPGTARG